MAFSSSIKKGQVLKCCELCETEIKITYKCINCKLFMCTKCKDKVHSKFQSADKHKILDIKELGKHSEELLVDFSYINCEDHEGEICVMFCKSCDQPVCTQCIAEVHNGHGLVKISEGYKIRIENVKEGQKLIKGHIEELTNRESKIKLISKSENSKYQKTRNAIQAHGEALKQAVDKYTEKLITELDQKWEILQNAMDNEERRFTTMKMSIQDLSKKADDIVNSKDADEVFRESKQVRKPLIDSVEPIKLDFTTMPKFLPGEITEHNVGSLQEMPTDLVMKVVKQFTTDITDVFFLSTCPDNTLWISDQKVLQRVKPERSNLKVMSNFNMKIYGMAVTPSNDLLLVPNASRLQQISGSSGQITDSVYSVDPLILTAVHVTSDYNVIVGAYNDNDRVVIIRMNKEGKHEKTYEHDRNKQPIFTYVWHITTTTNGTMFGVDELSDDYRGRVVVLGQDGDLINTYRGHPKINSDEQPFKPRRGVTTPLDNIIVTDLDTHTLHMLNCVGHPITYYNTNNLGILHPLSLSFTTPGQLYIGCSAPVDSTDKVKFYKVDIPQI